jgi:hypothetical protein
MIPEVNLGLQRASQVVLLATDMNSASAYATRPLPTSSVSLCLSLKQEQFNLLTA